MFKKSILVLLKSGLKVISTYGQPSEFEENVKHILTNFKHYIRTNENEVILIRNDSGEDIYVIVSDIVNVITFDTPKEPIQDVPVTQVN